MAMTDLHPSFFRIARRWSMLVLLASTLLVILSGVGFWIQWFMLAEDDFVDLTGNVLASVDVREAISRALIDRLLADFPILRSLVRDPLEAVASAILGSTLFETAIEFVSTRIWELLFVGGDPVVLNLEPLQNFLYGVISAIAPNLAEGLSPDQMPDELVLLNTSELPDMARVSDLLAWATWLALFAGLGLTAFVISRVWSEPLVRYALIAWTGILLAVEAIIVAILTIPTRSTVILAVESATARTVVGTTYDMLAQRLHGILLVLALLGGVLVTVGLWKRHSIMRMGTVPAIVVSEPQPPETQPQLAGID